MDKLYTEEEFKAVIGHAARLHDVAERLYTSEQLEAAARELGVADADLASAAAAVAIQRGAASRIEKPRTQRAAPVVDWSSFPARKLGLLGFTVSVTVMAALFVLQFWAPAGAPSDALMPWDGILGTAVKALTVPAVKVVCVVMTGIGGLLFAFGES